MKRQLAKGLTLELTLAERGGVAGDDDEFGLARTKTLQGRFVAQGHCSEQAISFSFDRVDKAIVG